MHVARSNKWLNLLWSTLALWLGLTACRTIPPYKKMLYKLNQVSALQRWIALTTFPKDVSEPSFRLIRVAQTLDHISQVQALLLLSDVKGWGRGVVDEVMKLAASNDDSLVRAASLLSLSRAIGLSSRLRKLLEAKLSDPSWIVRRYSLRTWMDLEGPSERLDGWCQKLLNDPHPAVRWDAVLCWRKRAQGVKSRSAVLQPLLQDTNFQVQQLVVQTLGWWGTPALSTLESSLQSPNEEVQCSSLRALSELRTQFTTIVPWMLTKLRSKSPAVQSCAIRALGTLAPYTILAIRPLMETVRNPSMLLSMDAIAHLKQSGELGLASVTVLMGVARDPKEPLYKRLEAVKAVMILTEDKKRWATIAKEAKKLNEPLSKKAQASLFGRRIGLNFESSVQVQFKRPWSAGERSQPLLFHIRENYLGMLQMCDIVDDERKPIKRKKFWVELFLQRHGEVVLPFVFKMDKKTPATDPCLNDSLWMWKFPVLSKNSRFAYLQFQLVLERNEPTKFNPVSSPPLPNPR